GLPGAGSLSRTASGAGGWNGQVRARSTLPFSDSSRRKISRGDARYLSGCAGSAAGFPLPLHRRPLGWRGADRGGSARAAGGAFGAAARRADRLAGYGSRPPAGTADRAVAGGGCTARLLVDQSRSSATGACNRSPAHSGWSARALNSQYLFIGNWQL